MAIKISIPTSRMNMIIKDNSKRFKTISTTTKVKCIPDSCDDVCSQSTDGETVDDSSNQVTAVDKSRRDWLMFKFEKPLDVMLPKRMVKGMKS